MPAFHLFAAAHRGGQHIYTDERLSAMGEMSHINTLLQSEKKPNRPIGRASIIFFLNILLGVSAGLIFRELELPEDLRIREERAVLIARLGGNQSMATADWEALMSSLGFSAAELQADVDALASGTLAEQDGNWDRSSSMFFAFTVATSIGYGTFSPVTSAGRAFTIVYALFSIPLMLAAFTNLTQLLLQLLARRMSGRNRDLPVKVFRMLDRDRTGTLNKAELITGLKLLGVGDYSGHGATLEKRRRFENIFREIDRDQSGELELQEFRLLLQKLVPDEDQVLILVDVVTRSYVAAVAIACFLAMVILTAVAFMHLKRAEDWTFLDSSYYTVITFFTIGLGDLAPDPHPWTYMVAWCTCTFFGLGFTTAMVQTLADPNLNFQASLRGLCPNWCTGALGHEELRNVRKSQVVRQNTRKFEQSSKNLIAGSSGRSPPPKDPPSPTTAESAITAKLSLPLTPAPAEPSGSMEA